MEKAGDLGPAGALGSEDPDGVLFPGEFHLFGQGSLGAAQMDPLGLLSGQGLPGALGDEVALNLRGEAKGEGQDLGLNVIPQAVAVLDGPHTTATLHTEMEDLHDHKQTPTQAGHLRAKDEVPLLDGAQEPAQLALVVILGARDGFFDPAIHGEALLLGEAEDLKTLVLYSLLLCTHSNVPVCHRILSFREVIEMKLIRTIVNPSGAYPPIQEGRFLAIPEGMALWPEELDTTDFYQYNGFVTLVTAQSEGITVVTGYQANVEAWEAWKESLPPDPGPEPEPDPDDYVTYGELAAAIREGVNSVE